MAGRLSLAGVLVIALAALFATPAAASDQACTRDVIGHARAATPHATLVDLVAPDEAAEVDLGGVKMYVPTLEFVVVRIKDGEPIMACVDSKKTALRFLNVPIEKIGGGKAAQEK